MNLKEEMHGAMMRLFGKHVKMEDCNNIGTLMADIDSEASRLIEIMVEKLTE